MDKKKKRLHGGAWEGSPFLVEFEQWARIALSAYENLNEYMIYSATPVFYVRGYAEPPPHIAFDPVLPPPDFVDTVRETQSNARRALIRLLDEIGMKSDAAALRLLELRIRENED
jgi:hypothetical protein